jgi:hypothetical protein
MSSWPGAAFAEMAEVCQQTGTGEHEGQGCSECPMNVHTPKAASEGTGVRGMRRGMSTEFSKEQWSLHAKLANAKAKSARDSKRFERAKVRQSLLMGLVLSDGSRIWVPWHHFSPNICRTAQC